MPNIAISQAISIAISKAISKAISRLLVIYYFIRDCIIARSIMRLQPFICSFPEQYCYLLPKNLRNINL